MARRRSRRRFLAAATTTTGICVAGCSSGSDTKLQLRANQIDDLARGPDSRFGRYLLDPLAVESAYSIDLSDEYKRSTVDELVDTGTVSTRGWELSSRSRWGTTWRDRRTVFESGGTYYRVRVEERADIERGRWVFYFDWNEQDPAADATIITLSDNTLSEQDRQIVEAAQELIPPSDRRDVSYDRPRYSRAVVFHEELDTDASDLVPEPPFEYLEHDGEYFRAVSERGPVELPERTFSVEPVGDSLEAYRQYAQEAYPDVRFSTVDLSDEAAEILDETTRGDDHYETDPPLPDGLAKILDHLTITDDHELQEPYDESMYFYNALAEHNDRWYAFDFIVRS